MHTAKNLLAHACDLINSNSNQLTLPVRFIIPIVQRCLNSIVILNIALLCLLNSGDSITSNEQLRLINFIPKILTFRWMHGSNSSRPFKCTRMIQLNYKTDRKCIPGGLYVNAIKASCDEWKALFI